VAQFKDFSDHLHSTGVEDQHTVRTVDFPYDEVDRALGFEPEEETVAWKDAVSAWSLLLGWMCGRSWGSHISKPSIVGAGWRAHALLYLLDSGNARYDSLQAIADDAGVTKQMVSKALANLREELGDILPFKRSLSSDVYRRAQSFAMDAGVHASLVRKDLKSKRAKRPGAVK